MRNGDLMRTRILEVSEKLFFEKGYAETSVQEILDAVNLSKGGFYHHFSSKDAILREILEESFTEQLRKLDMELSALRMRPIDKLNRILREAILLRREDTEHAALLLKLCYAERDIEMLTHVRERLFEGLLPRLRGAVDEGIQDGSMFTRYPGAISELLLRLVLDTDELCCRKFIDGIENPEIVVELAEYMCACTESVEMLIGATFGSVEILELTHLLTASREIAKKLS